MVPATSRARSAYPHAQSSTQHHTEPEGSPRSAFIADGQRSTASRAPPPDLRSRRPPRTKRPPATAVRASRGPGVRVSSAPLFDAARTGAGWVASQAHRRRAEGAATAASPDSGGETGSPPRPSDLPPFDIVLVELNPSPARSGGRSAGLDTKGACSGSFRSDMRLS